MWLKYRSTLTRGQCLLLLATDIKSHIGECGFFTEVPQAANEDTLGRGPKRSRSNLEVVGSRERYQLLSKRRTEKAKSKRRSSKGMPSKEALETPSSREATVSMGDRSTWALQPLRGSRRRPLLSKRRTKKAKSKGRSANGRHSKEALEKGSFHEATVSVGDRSTWAPPAPKREPATPAPVERRHEKEMPERRSDQRGRKDARKDRDLDEAEVSMTSKGRSKERCPTT